MNRSRDAFLVLIEHEDESYSYVVKAQTHAEAEDIALGNLADALGITGPLDPEDVEDIKCVRLVAMFGGAP